MLNSQSPGMKKSRLPAEVDDWSQKIIAASIEVHRTLGPGYLESIYVHALAIEFQLRMIPFTRQNPMAVTYKGASVGEQRLDFVVASSVILELKAVEVLSAVHEAQLLSYLKAANLKLGLLINFNVALLRHGLRRIVHPDYFK